MKKLLPFILLGAAALFIFPFQHNTYEVVKGDTLSKIASKYGVSVDQLKDWNNLSSDLIEIGQVLTVKADAPPTQINRKKALAKKKNNVPQDVVLHKMGMTAAPTKKLPKAKRCLSGPDSQSLDDEYGMMTNQGLSSNQISQAMNKFFPQLADCMPDVWPTANIELDFNVGCNGLVSYVRIVKDDNLDFDIQQCLEESFQYAEFPAHDLPDGMDFTYPIQFEPG